MKSIITDELDKCIVCGCGTVEMHHTPFGTAQRILADRYHLIVPLCPEHHRGTNGVHGRDGAELRHKIDRMAQEAFERAYPEDSFLRVFGRNCK